MYHAYMSRPALQTHENLSDFSFIPEGRKAGEWEEGREKARKPGGEYRCLAVHAAEGSGGVTSCEDCEPLIQSFVMPPSPESFCTTNVLASCHLPSLKPFLFCCLQSGKTARVRAISSFQFFVNIFFLCHFLCPFVLEHLGLPHCFTVIGKSFQKERR